MPNLGQFLQQLANKAGIDTADLNLVGLLSNADLNKITVHSDLAAGIDNSLLSLTQAQDNHPTIQAKYKAQTLNAFDKKMEEVMAGAGLSEEKIDELKGEKNTFKRFELMTTAINEAATTKAKTASTEDKSALQQQVDDLAGKLRKAKTDSDAALATVQEERRKDRVSYELRALLGPIKTVFDEMPIEAKNAALDSLINKALQEKGASFSFTEAGEFVLKGKDDTTVLGANNVKYTPQSLIDEVLAQNKVLKVSEQPSDTTQRQQGGGNTTRVTSIDAGKTTLSGNNQTTANLNRRNREAAAQQ